MRTTDVIIADLPTQERHQMNAHKRRLVAASDLHLADLRAHCDRQYPDVEREDPRDLLPFNWRARMHGVARATVSHFR